MLAVVLLAGASSATAGSGPFGSDAFALRVGDLDGDGRADLVVQSGYRSDTLTVTALRGVDGSTLWTTAIGIPAEPWGAWNSAVPAALGATGEPGVLVVAHRSGNGGTGLHLIALGRDGRRLWRRDERGVDRSPVSHEVPALYAVLRAQGLADDILIGSTSTLAVETIRITQRRLMIVSGETGKTVAEHKALGGAEEIRAQAIGDVTGDGLEDVGLVRSGAARTLAALRGTDLAVLWEAPIHAGLYDRILPIPDATGDGRAEILVVGSPTYPPSPNISLLDGSDGHLLWARSATTALGAGDADGDGLAEALTLVEQFDASPSGVAARLTFEATTSAGETIYAKTHEASFGLSGSLPCVGKQAVGDVDADGILDVAYQIYMDCRYSIEAEGGMVSGATGDVLWTKPSIGLPLQGSVDGNGNDLAMVVPNGSSTIVTAIDGVDGSTIWTGSAPGSYGGSSQSALAHDLDGDGRAEIVPSIPGGPVTALRGTDGSILWSRS